MRLPICDFYFDKDGETYIIKVWTAEDGVVTDWSMHGVRPDGTEQPPITANDLDEWVQLRYQDWIDSRWSDQ